jgi:hypothetical protein
MQHLIIENETQSFEAYADDSADLSGRFVVTVHPLDAAYEGERMTIHGSEWDIFDITNAPPTFSDYEDRMHERRHLGLCNF